MVSDQGPTRNLRTVLLLNAVVFVLLGSVLFQPKATLGQTTAATDPNLEFKFQDRALPDLDTRTNVVAHTSTQLTTVRNLGARKLDQAWHSCFVNQLQGRLGNRVDRRAGRHSTQLDSLSKGVVPFVGHRS